MPKNRDIPEKNQRFKEFRKMHKLTQKALGEILGLSQAAVAGIEAGLADVAEAYVRILQNAFNLNPSWLKEGIDCPVLPGGTVRGIPILADIPAGPVEYWYDSYAAGAGDDYVYAPGVRGENLFAVRVKGDSMEPQLYEGYIVVINPHLEFNGGISVVRNNEGYTIKNVRMLEGGKYLLCPMNPKYDIIEIVAGPDTRFYVPVKVISLKDI